MRNQARGKFSVTPAEDGAERVRAFRHRPLADHRPYNKRPMNLFRPADGQRLHAAVAHRLAETLIARAFGASQYTDAFVAFRIRTLRRLSAEGAFSQAFVPILAEFKNQQGHDATKRSSTRCPPCWRGRLPCCRWSGSPAHRGSCSPSRPACTDGQAFARRHDDADHVPVHRVHLADDARLRRAEHATSRCPRSRRCCSTSRSSPRRCSSRRT